MYVQPDIFHFEIQETHFQDKPSLKIFYSKYQKCELLSHAALPPAPQASNILKKPVPQQHILGIASHLWAHQAKGVLDKMCGSYHHIHHTATVCLRCFHDHRTSKHIGQPLKRQHISSIMAACILHYRYIQSSSVQMFSKESSTLVLTVEVEHLSKNTDHKGQLLRSEVERETISCNRHVRHYLYKIGITFFKLSWEKNNLWLRHSYLLCLHIIVN